MLISRGAKLLLGLALGTSLLMPRSSPADAPPELTVVAPRPPTAEELAGNSVTQFVQSHGKPGRRIGQLGRWEKGPCPATVGLSPAFNEYVTTRIHAIEVAAQIPQPFDAACKQHNVLIVFTTEPQKFMDDVAKNKSSWLGFHYLADIAKLKTIQRPIQAWYATATRSRSIENHFPANFAGPQPDVVFDDAWSSTPAAALGSRLTSGQESAIVFALIVVDTTKVTGYPIGSISDYIAMLSLQQTQLVEGCGTLPSILDLMSSCEHAKADAITAGDIAYLKALYRIEMAHELSMQRSTIENIMLRRFKGDD